jgi:hypothetical protein
MPEVGTVFAALVLLPLGAVLVFSLLALLLNPLAVPALRAYERALFARRLARAARADSAIKARRIDAALHELELGRADDVLVRFGSCTARAGAGGLFDGSSLLWRCQLLGYADPGSDPGETRVSEMVAPMRESVPFTFVGAHVAIGLATDNDAEGLRRFAADAAGFTPPGAAEILPDLALGFAAFVEGDHASASDHLLRRAGDFPRLGGSHAQREVFEDTLIHALIGAGRLEEASERLQARLDRRPSPIDSALLDRARPAADLAAARNRTPAPFPRAAE